MKKFFKNWEVTFYDQSGRPFSHWIGIEYQHQQNTKIYLWELGFWFFYLEINYDGTYTNFTEL